MEQAKNLFISNFNKKVLAILRLSRAFFAFLAFLLLAQLLFIQIANITKEGSKQLVQYKRQWARDKDLIKGVKDKDLVFIFGHSQIAAGIIPEIFDEINAHTTYSYNLALPTLPLAPHYFLLKDYLKKHKPPQYVVMTLNPGGFNAELFPVYSIQGAGLREILQYALFGKMSRVLSNYLFPYTFYYPEVKRYFEGKVLQLVNDEIRSIHRDRYYRRFSGKETYHHNWKYFYESQYLFPEENMRQRKEFIERNRGYYYIIEQAAIDGRLPDDYILKTKPKSKKIDQKIAQKIAQKIDQKISLEANDPFIDLFFTLAQKNNIKVILISDYTIIDQAEQLTSLPAIWKNVKEKYKNVYFAEDGFKYKFYHPKYFSDPVHVNPEGARLYTREIAEEFKKIINNIKNMKESTGSP